MGASFPGRPQDRTPRIAWRRISRSRIRRRSSRRRRSRSRALSSDEDLAARPVRASRPCCWLIMTDVPCGRIPARSAPGLIGRR